MIHHVHSIDEFVSAVSTAKIVVVDFSAAWCPPCKASAPLFARLAEKYASIATFLSIDVDLHPEITAEAGVTVMPTFQFIMDGKRVAGTEVKGANIAAVEAMIVKLGASADAVVVDGAPFGSSDGDYAGTLEQISDAGLAEPTV